MHLIEDLMDLIYTILKLRPDIFFVLCVPHPYPIAQTHPPSHQVMITIKLARSSAVLVSCPIVSERNVFHTAQCHLFLLRIVLILAVVFTNFTDLRLISTLIEVINASSMLGTKTLSRNKLLR